MQYKILVVEDNLPNLENTIELLELSNFIVFATINGKDGLQIALQQNPDLILCDKQMPVMNGYQLLELVRSIPRFKYIPFVFLSTSSEKKDIEMGFAEGANDYILKPFTGYALLHKMEKYLKQPHAMLY